jgi:uncharacterized protein YndB with AHSA1/START domain
MSSLQVVAEPGTHTVVLTREFNAPRELLYKAYTDPALIPRWWGFEGTLTTVHALEPKVGGRWHYAQSSAEGESYGAHYGVFHETSAPEQLVYTYEFDGMPGHIGLVTTRFEALGDRTLVSEIMILPSVEDRDGLVATGMAEGADASWNRLEALAQSL